MKKSKLLRVICILLCATLFLTGCKNPYQYYLNPFNQPSTTWRSEDGSITFHIPEDRSTWILGTMEVDGQNLDIIIDVAPAECWAGIYLSSVVDTFPETAEADSPLEEWCTSVISAKTFQVEIRESIYFREGQTIVFHRVDE